MSWITRAAVLAVLATGAIARPDTYWFAWEGEGATAALPEQCGWVRNWGNWQGQYKGPGATRTIADGVLTYDSLYDPGVFDFSFMIRPGQMDCGPGQVFIMEWRAKIDEITGWYCDPEVCFVSDEVLSVAFRLQEAAVWCGYEESVVIPVTPGVFHSYQVLSWDMLTYQLLIDDQLAQVGPFEPHVSPSYVAWGDSAQGAASLHHWDYFRYGVVLAPQVGDVNCDGVVDFADINPFVQALTDQTDYEAEYPGCWPENADINSDGSIDFGDINPFVELLLAL